MSLLNSAHLCLQKTSARVVWLMLLAALLSGCGGSKAEVAPVSGRVTLDGAPLAGARIRFQPEASGGSPSYGAADSDGQYVLGYKRGQPGALIGWHTVSIERGGHDDSANKSKPKALPARYNTASDLRKEVKAGEDNVIHFELTTDGK
jgi:hypothetical protein